MSVLDFPEYIENPELEDDSEGEGYYDEEKSLVSE